VKENLTRCIVTERDSAVEAWQCFRLLEVTMVRRVQPKSLFGVVGSAVLGATLAMTACGGDGDDGDDDTTNGGSSSGGSSTAGNGSTASATGGTQSASGGTSGGTQSATGGAPSGGGVAGRQFLPNLRKNTAPSAN
jgi:hypothetical protein